MGELNHQELGFELVTFWSKASIRNNLTTGNCY